MAQYLHCIKKERGILYELARTIRRQPCALLIGLGLALPIEVDNGLSQSHLKELLGRMVQWGLGKKVFTKKDIKNDQDIENDDAIEKEFEEMLTTGGLDRAERKLQEYLDSDMRKQCVNEVLLQSQHEVRYIYRLLANMPFRVFLTTGFDEFLENEYTDLKHLPLSKYYKSSLDDALVAYATEEPFVLKLHGDVAEDSPEVLTLSNRFAKGSLPEAIIYPEPLRKLLADMNTLFVGFEKADPDFRGLKSTVNKKDELKRWLLVPEDHLTEQQAELLWNEDKIAALCYANRSELVSFLEKLAEVAATPQEIEVYISYAQEDQEIRERLQKHLNNVMDATGLKITWSDGRIQAGQVQRPVIENRLQKAQVVLLLLSVDYL
jgi:SIR2-like domain